ncbi:MAG: hypothetical protein AB1449_14855 [Chloroflexota bacterium]
MATSVLGNLYDYTLGEHRGEGIRGFLVSTGVDFVMTVGTGLAAAGLVAGIVVTLPFTVPLVATVAGTAIAGVGISWILDRYGVGEWLKKGVSDGFDAWAGVWDNIGTIGRALPGYVREAVLRPAARALQERVVQPVVQAVHDVSRAVRDAAASVGEAVSGFFGRFFGGG